VSARRQRTSPEDVQQIVARALDCESCSDCGAAPGEPCVRPGPGRTVCKSRFIAAAIALSREARAGQRTPEQDAVLAGLPKVSRAEIEACRTPKGGYAFTKAWFLEHGLPYPPVAGWRQAVEREQE
jgi:hypothetical protein